MRNDDLTFIVCRLVEEAVEVEAAPEISVGLFITADQAAALTPPWTLTKESRSQQKR
jgi:hypothetical protein